MSGQRWVFRGSSDHRGLGYLGFDGLLESRRAREHDARRSYLKEHATLAPLTPADVALFDLKTVGLDLAARSRRFEQPASTRAAVRLNRLR